MSVESQYLGIKWSKTLEGLIELYNKKKACFRRPKSQVKRDRWRARARDGYFSQEC